MKTRFVISLIVVNAIVLAACGTGSESRGPRQIPVGSGSNATRDAKLAGGSASDMPMLAPDVTYEPADNLVVDFDTGNPDATFPSWEFAAPENPARALQGIVDALRIGPGVKVRKQANVPGGYGINVTDGPSFTSYGDRLSRWWSFSVSQMMQGDTAVSPPCAPDTKDCGGSWTTVPPVTNLPTVREATAHARELLGSMDVDTSSLTFSGSKDDWATRVSASFLMGDVVTPMTWTFTFGENGTLTEADGPVFTVTKADSYPVVPVTEAIARLNSPGTWGPGNQSMMREAITPKPVDQSQTATITITSARLSLAPYWTGSGQLLMLPAYAFRTGGSQEEVSVVAVPDRFFIVPDEVIDPSPVTVVPGASTGSGSGTAGSGGSSAGSSPVPTTPTDPPTVESARVLVGLTEAEAGKVAASRGWVMRVVRLDGEDLAVTLEYSASRVNVEVTKKVVTAVLSIG